MEPIRERPHRWARSCYRGMVTVSFTACLACREPIFTEPETVSACLKLLRDAVDAEHGVADIYCFMPEHLHLMLSGQGPESDLWQALVRFKQRSGWWLKCHRSPVAWQKDFYDHIVTKQEDLGAQVRYIAANPVRRGLVSDWRQYPFTGATGTDLEAIVSGAILL